MKPHPEGQQAAYLTVREVAELLAVAVETVYDLVKAGKLQAVRVGRAIRIPRAGLEDYLAGRGPSRPTQPPAGGRTPERRRRIKAFNFFPPRP